jgi:hypothetical protein
MRFVVLNQDAFDREYRKAVADADVPSDADKERFRDTLFGVRGAVEEALAAKWQKVVYKVGLRPTGDFEVGWDFDYCFHTCGGIYSETVFCSDYVNTVADALASVDPKGEWVYHTVCEIVVNPEGKTIGEVVQRRGEFFIRAGICYINGTMMKKEWRARLGCPD